MTKRAKISPDGLLKTSEAQMGISSNVESSASGEATVSMAPLTDKMRGWNERVTTNADWETFYKAQGICEDEAEFALMKETFLLPLPVAIKVNTSSSTPGSVERILNELAALDDSRLEKCKKLSWSVDGTSWQWSDVSRVHVRKDPSLIQLKKWLMDHEQIGTLTRQEAVSMIPPIALDVLPGDIVLDMCAAPGSKTCQLLEMVGDTGVVMANDVEWKRANMLSHQVQRLCCPSNIVSNVDACSFPGSGVFDKILCDVPCTGDGTIRKAQDIWRRWQIVDGMNIHSRQLQILNRGLSMLREGGVLVYSTCSLNPIENEAVVAAALAKFAGQVELVPMADLPGLAYKSGLASWVVFDDRTKEPVSRETLLQMESENKQARLRNTMLPPVDPVIANSLALTRRFLPHLMNTGGFYVAKFQKTGAAAPPTTPVTSTATPASQTDFDIIPESIYENLTSFYGLDRSIISRDQLCMHKQFDRHVYLVSKAASTLIRTASSALKLVSIGVRVFADIGKWESACPFRLTQEGVHAFRNAFVPGSARVGYLSEEAFLELLTTREIRGDLASALPAFANIAKGGGVVYMDKEVAESKFGGSVGLSVMATPEIVQVYAEKLYCGWLENILRGKFDPTTPATQEPAGQDDAQ